MPVLYTNDAKSVHSFTESNTCNEYMGTPNALTPAQIKRRAAMARLLASLPVPQHTSIATPQAVKARPASGVFASV